MFAITWVLFDIIKSQQRSSSLHSSTIVIFEGLFLSMIIYLASRFQYISHHIDYSQIAGRKEKGSEIYLRTLLSNVEIIVISA